MKLLTKEIEGKLPAIRSQEYEKNPKIVVKFFHLVVGHGLPTKERGKKMGICYFLEWYTVLKKNLVTLL